MEAKTTHAVQKLFKQFKIIIKSKKILQLINKNIAQLQSKIMIPTNDNFQ